MSLVVGECCRWLEGGEFGEPGGVTSGGEGAPQVWHGWRLLVSGAALSLDDLAVGLALGTVRYPIVLAVTLFGLMSFVMSIIGLKLGGRLGAAAGEHGEVVGAIVLIGIAGAMAMGWLLAGRAQASPHRLGQGQAGHDDHQQGRKALDPTQRQDPLQPTPADDGHRDDGP